MGSTMKKLRTSVRYHSHFSLVYQGGHHDVWCNGETHIRMGSGSHGWAPISSKPARHATLYVFKCDCDEFK